MRHIVSAVILALLVPAAAFAQTDAPSQVLSTNPFGLIIKWPNVEYERRITPSATFGASSSAYVDDHQANVAVLLRWYPDRAPLHGFYLGARAGAYHFKTYRYDLRSYRESSTTLPGAGVEIGYNWLLGPRRNVMIGTGFGLTRILNGGGSWSLPEVVPSLRLVNIGIAF
jgi:Protein of unknown function (DUF3575)